MRIELKESLETGKKKAPDVVTLIRDIDELEQFLKATGVVSLERSFVFLQMKMELKNVKDEIYMGVKK